MISFWHRLLNLISPDACVVCGCRLGVEEEVMCTSCNLHLPRTFFAAQGLDNLMARRFWGRIPIERAAALFYYEAGSEVSRIIYQLKYNGRPDIGEVMGRMTAEEFAASGFFEGIDLIIPVPLAQEPARAYGECGGCFSTDGEGQPSESSCANGRRHRHFWGHHLLVCEIHGGRK